jgi:hypothetical protein
MVACAGDSSVGIDVALARSSGSGFHDEQSGQAHRRACGSTRANGFRKPRQWPQRTGSFSRRSRPSMGESGENMTPYGAASESASAADCGQTCHERRTPLRFSSARTSTPGPG